MKRLVPLSLVLLAACQQSSDAPAGEATATPAATPTAVVGSLLSLDPLQDADGQVIADSMSNIGGCAYYDKDGRALLSVGIPDNYDLPVGAGGDAIGVARVNGKQVKLTAEKGDAGYVEAGPKLTGDGYMLTVLRAEGEGKPTGREEVEYAADLVVADGSGDSRTYTPGGWRCGV